MLKSWRDGKYMEETSWNYHPGPGFTLFGIFWGWKWWSGFSGFDHQVVFDGVSWGQSMGTTLTPRLIQNHLGRPWFLNPLFARVYVSWRGYIIYVYMILKYMANQFVQSWFQAELEKVMSRWQKLVIWLSVLVEIPAILFIGYRGSQDGRFAMAAMLESCFWRVSLLDFPMGKATGESHNWME